MIKNNKCRCGCGKSTSNIWSTGHNLKLHPRPQNLGKYIKGVNGSEHPMWKGGKRLTKDGYLEIYSPNHPNKNSCNYVLEHRLIMESKIKRYLKMSEIVHHEDRNKLNNNILNLTLVKNQSEHNNHHNIDRDKLGRFTLNEVSDQ